MASRKNPSPLVNPQSASAPSSGINVDEAIRIAEELDRETQMHPDEPPKKQGRSRQTKKRDPAPVAEESAPEVVVIPPPDPEFVAMCNWGINAGLETVKGKFEWSDPGVTWRIKVSEALARLISRIQPMEPGPITDAITIAGYVGIYVVSNVSQKRETTNTDIVRDNGVRQNVQNEGIAPT